MSETYSKKAFWAVKTIMLFLILVMVLMYGSWNYKQGQRDKERELYAIRALQYLKTGQSFCKAGPDYYTIRKFDMKTLVLKVKREDRGETHDDAR